VPGAELEAGHGGPARLLVVESDVILAEFAGYLQRINDSRH
jgi:hypothetical protein